VKWLSLDFLLSLIVLPVLPALVDLVPATMARRHREMRIPKDCPRIEDFTVLVPIYGDIRYLENVDYLSSYSSRVVLCTTTGESDQFYSALQTVARQHAFGIRRFPVTSRQSSGKRSTTGTIRDQLIRQATEFVETRFVVCLDADTTTERPLQELVGATHARGLELAGVRLVPSNTSRLLGKLQAHEYRMAMRMRRVVPYLCSGALQISTREAHRKIMRRHSMFFQGNDAEMGLLGRALGFRVGYLPFDVPTQVPDRYLPWLRQRMAWAGGQFRLCVVNVPLIRRYPFLMIYQGVIVILLFPLRWAELLHPGYWLLGLFAVYTLTVTVINWPDRDFSLVLYPFYGLFHSVVLAPVGIVTYVMMATRHRNIGFIRPGRRQHSRQLPVPAGIGLAARKGLAHRA
jgi:cellulose synthase/poly-beta-1,6-N-acetylglucosamine synthase-like glycosyltransferase